MTLLQPPRVIVGVGDIEDGVRPLAWALAEARRRGAQLHAVRVWYEVSQPGLVSGSWCHPREQDAERILTDALTMVTGGVPPEFSSRLVARQGYTPDVLVRYADQEDDLLVLGTSRHRPWWPFGDKTVQTCVRKASCPVVVVPRAPLAGSASTRKLLRDLRRDLKQLERTNA